MPTDPGPDPHGGEPAWRLTLANEAATERLAGEVASLVRGGDLITLSGDLGAGKTTFARALIRSITADAALEVPSPTFTLMQTYDGPNFPIVHADLYRVRHEDELAELGWDDARDEALLMVEWADRAGTSIAPDRLDIAFSTDIERGPQHRNVVLRGMGAFAARIARAQAIHSLLREAGWADASRTYIMGDASTRAYERLSKPDGRTAILMIAPARAPAPAVRRGKPYSVIARLSQSIDAFVAIDEGLRARGFSAPEIYAVNRPVGLAILEDLGSEGIVDHDGPMPDRYAEAAALLARLHSMILPESLPIGTDQPHEIPPYDLDAMLIEVELILEWYGPHVLKVTLPASTRANFVKLWRTAIEDLIAGTPQPTWVLRDYHSPNLIWLEGRDGIARLGLIDFQDCVRGSPAYDVAALLQDARITVPDTLELRLLGHYAQLRRRTDPGFDTAAFARAYAIAGAQRATKILGLFTRLDKQDGKPRYLSHLPRVEHYLAKNLGHPALAELRQWYEAHLPRAVRRA